MALHGVEASEYVSLSNMKFLLAEFNRADKVVDYRREAFDDRDLSHDNSHHKLASGYSYGLLFQIVIDKCLSIHDRGFKKKEAPMLTIQIECTCPICSHPVTIKSIPTAKSLYRMADNQTKATPFIAYHHPGFGDDLVSGYDKGHSLGTCENCNAEFSIETDIISVLCNCENIDKAPHTGYKPEVEYSCSTITFTKWLKNQRHRSDIVGDFSRDAFYTEGKSRNVKKHLDREHPSRPKNAARYDEWIKYLDNGNHKKLLFYACWAEYQILKDYCTYSRKLTTDFPFTDE